MLEIYFLSSLFTYLRYFVRIQTIVNLCFANIVFPRYRVAERLAIRRIIISVRSTSTLAPVTANGSPFQMRTGASFTICVKSK